MRWQCYLAQRLVARKFRQSLSPRQTARLSAHLARCEDCARSDAVWSHIDRSGPMFGKASPPAGMAERIADNTLSAIGRAGPTADDPFASFLPTGTVISLAVAALAFITIGRGHPPGQRASGEPAAIEATLMEPVAAMTALRGMSSASITRAVIAELPDD